MTSTVLEKITLIKGDITKVNADAIVNAANTSLMGGGGVDGAIHRAGGKTILDECRKIVARQGGCRTGEAVLTTAGNLQAKFVIHTVGPVWNGGTKGEADLLARCYSNSLQLAAIHQCTTIAFPCISTGIYRFPIADAAEIAVIRITSFLSDNNSINRVFLVCYDQDNFNALERVLNSRA